MASGRVISKKGSGNCANSELGDCLDDSNKTKTRSTYSKIEVMMVMSSGFPPGYLYPCLSADFEKGLDPVVKFEFAFAIAPSD